MNMADLRNRIAASVLPEVRAAALVGVRAVLTEENSDAIIERVVGAVKAKMPAYLRWLPIGLVLDRLMPEVLLRVFEETLS